MNAKQYVITIYATVDAALPEEEVTQCLKKWIDDLVEPMPGRISIGDTSAEEIWQLSK